MGRRAPDEATACLRKIGAHVRIERAILFGSRARGEALASSDYDLIVVSPDFRGAPFHARSAPLLLLWGREQDLELLCYTPEEFDRARDGLGVVGTAAREGLALS